MEWLGTSRPQSPKSASTLTTPPRLDTIAIATAALAARPPSRDPPDVELAGTHAEAVAGRRRDHHRARRPGSRDRPRLTSPRRRRGAFTSTDLEAGRSGPA